MTLLTRCADCKTILGCDGCGAVGWNWQLLSHCGWRRYHTPSGYPGGFLVGHHCPNCVNTDLHRYEEHAHG